MNSKHPFKHFSKAAIETAISVLEQASQPQKTSSISSIRDLIAATFSSRARVQLAEKRQNIKETVLKAIGTLKHYHPILAQMHAGDSEEKKLAASATAAITRFNAALASPITPSFSQWITPYHEEEPLEELRKHRFEFNLAPHNVNEKICSAFYSHLTAGIPHSEITPPEIDVLRLKANMLLKQKDIYIGSPAETIAAIQEGKIETKLESNIKIATLTLLALPGISIQIKGSFQCYENIRATSAPISKSFELTLHASDRDYPFPAEYIGWSLGGVLISKENQKAYHAEFLDPYQRNNKISHVRRLLKCKRQTFIDNKTTLIELHRNLIFKLLENSENQSEIITITDHFFQQVSLHEYFYEYLSETYELINTNFLTQPYNRLQELWFTQLINQPLDDVKTAIDLVLTNEMEANISKLSDTRLSAVGDIDRNTIDYALLCGKYLWPYFKTLIVHHFSALAKMQAPPLDNFSQKLQLLAQRQLFFCLEEIELAPSDVTPHIIQKRLLEEFLIIFKILD